MSGILFFIFASCEPLRPPFFSSDDPTEFCYSQAYVCLLFTPLWPNFTFQLPYFWGFQNNFKSSKSLMVWESFSSLDLIFQNWATHIHKIKNLKKCECHSPQSWDNIMALLAGTRTRSHLCEPIPKLRLTYNQCHYNHLKYKRLLMNLPPAGH